MGKKIVLDTNVFISALGWKGNSRIIFNKIINKEYELLISNKQLLEIKRVLDYPKFKFTTQQKVRFLKILYEIARIIKTKIKIDIIKEDPSDNILLEAAIEGKTDFIITGDKHLLKLKTFKDTIIITPKEFLNK